MDQQKTDSPKPSQLKWVALRVAQQALLLLLLGIALYAAVFAVGGDHSVVAIGWSMLFVLPFSIGALAELGLGDRAGNEARPAMRSIQITLGVLVVAAIILREGLICLLMLFPLWLLAGVLGSTSVRNLRKTFNERHRTSIVLLAMLPFAALFVDANIRPNAERFTVTRSVVVNSSPDQIWPHLLRLDGLSDEEGVWNISQDVLGIPRPSSAVVNRDGIGAVRLAQWGDNIRFEEHITSWRENEEIAWKFVFPDDSISRYTDPHIHPDGASLKVATGAYRMTQLPDGNTRLTLETNYIVQTPVNLYAALWGELALGDIQTNILTVVKSRAANE